MCTIERINFCYAVCDKKGGLVGIWPRFCGKSVIIVITGIPSHHTFVLSAWSTKIFLVKCFRQIKRIFVHFFKVSLSSTIDPSHKNIRKLRSGAFFKKM